VADKFKVAQPWLTLLARLILGAVLLVAGALKVPNLPKSAMAVRAYEMLPIPIANFLGYTLPWIEIGLGLLLIVGVTVKISGALGALTMLAFIIAIAQAWARGLSIDCGCFGGGGTIDPEDTKYLSEIIRDIGLMGLGIFLYLYPISNRASSNFAIPAAVSEADGYGIVLNPTATPTIDIWVDYQCPACRTFEVLNGGYINEIIAQKKAKVVFHPLTFIGAESIIAANAAACAADENKFVDMNLALFQNQGGSENSGRWQGDAMLAIGESIGIKSDTFKECVREGNYVKWTRNVTDASASKNVNSTPTIRINGKDLDRNTEYGDPVKFKAALAAGGVK